MSKSKIKVISVEDNLKQKIIKEKIPPKMEYTNIIPTNCKNKLLGILFEPEIKELTFTPETWIKINAYSHLIGNLEITGFGKIENEFITDIDIIEQVVNKMTTESLDIESVTKFYQKIPENERQYWKLDWHSHVNSSTNPSSVDINNYNTINTLMAGEPFISLIINKSQKVWASYFIGDSTYLPIIIKVPTKFELTNKKIFEKIYKICEKNIKNKCIKQTVINLQKNYQQDNYFSDNYRKVLDNLYPDNYSKYFNDFEF